MSAFSTPQEAVREMIAAGALFDIRRRDDALAFSFTYRVAAGGDPPRCREVLAAVKARPPIFFQAFRAAVQEAVCREKPVEIVQTTSTEVAGAATPPTRSKTSKVVATTLLISGAPKRGAA